MRILLDTCLPRNLCMVLSDYDTTTAHQAGLNFLNDGPLLAAMTGRFDVLVTLDKSLPFQQNLAGRPIAIIVLRARSSKISDLRPLIPALRQALAEVMPGEAREVRG